ncbi:uncharacterized protein [Asterias amurensis]|uniref:uncharacterized protein isoform X1 n=1 Tax=Asterias amurensis TaxID=7602 RepID=UPI003AB5D39B
MNEIECVGQVLEIGQLDFEESTFICEICDKHCISHIHLLEHQKTHIVHVPKRKTYVCDICGFICNRRGHLSKHKRLHDKSQPYACTMCDKVCLSKHHLKAHQQCHVTPKVKPFVCNICNYACTRRAHLERHQRRHTKEKPFTCECGKAFSCKGNFVKHQRSHSEEKPFICEICGKGFSLSNYLMVHKNFHHTDQGGFSSGIEDNFFVKAEDVKPQETVVQTHDYPFVCTICGVSFLHKYSLITHHKVHTEKEQFVCNICQKECLNQIHLAAHQKTHNYPFICTICGFACKRIGHLTRHQRTHTKEKPFICKFCAKTFACKGNLVKHQSRVHPAETQAELNLQNSHSHRGSPQKRRHIEKASFVCDACGRSFYRQHYLDCHKKIHADEVGFEGLEEQGQEEIDGPKMPTKDKPHVCDVCGYSCGLRGTMKRHQRIHTNERPFSCETCGKAFSIRWNLKIHKERVHVGGRGVPYQKETAVPVQSESEVHSLVEFVASLASNPIFM